MAYIKLDCGILNSTLWPDRDCRELFLTALLMAEPKEIKEPQPTIKITSLEAGDYIVPPNWYGYVPAASNAIARAACVDYAMAIKAFERLASPEIESRTPDHEGRRLVRISGGFLVLNYDTYRRKDHTAAERSKRYRKNLFAKLSQKEPEKTAVPALADVIEYAMENGIKTSDAEYFFNKSEGNGWMVGGSQIKSWKHILLSWKTAGYLPSQKQPKTDNNGNF